MEHSSVDYQLTDMTVLRPAFTPNEVAELRQQMAWHHPMGIESSWLDATTLNSMDTWLPPETLGALSTPEAQLETYPFAIALAKAAERHGVKTRIGEVTGLTRASLTGGRSRVTGVTLGGEHIPAHLVVVASGPWSSLAGAWLGYQIPVKPLKGQIVYLVPPKPLPGYSIFHESGYVLPKPSGKLMVGTTEEDAGFDSEPTMQAQTAIMTAAVRLAPRLAGVPVRDVTACLRPLSADGLPFIGPSPQWEGVYLATGHGRKGILLSLATGKYLAQLIAQGRSDYSLEPFSPQRLALGTPR
jgi:glycine oxidase